MPNYVILYNWTEQRIKNAKHTIKRSKSFETAIEKVDGKSKGLGTWIVIRNSVSGKGTRQPMVDQNSASQNDTINVFLPLLWLWQQIQVIQSNIILQRLS